MNKNNDDEIIRIINFLLKKDKKIERIVKKWIPKKSIVCWYLWKALDEGVLKKNG